MYLRVKCRLGGRNMVPVVVWPTLILRGVSQPTPNAPKVPRAVGVCLGISNAHVCASMFPYFHILRPQNIRKNATVYESKFGPEGMFTNDYMST